MATFNFEELIVWQKAVEFIDSILEKTSALYDSKGSYRLREQLDSGSSSIALNIAEGKGRNSDKEFLQFLYYSRGSLYETVTILILLNKRRFISDEDLVFLKDKGAELGKMINGLITSIKRNS